MIVNIKKVLYVLLFFIISLSILWMVFFYPNWNEKNKIKKLCEGTYIVDIGASDSLTDREIEYYSGTKLWLKSNGSFLFSKSVPVAEGSAGNWQIIGSEISRAIKLTYENCTLAQISTCDSVGCITKLQIPIYDENILVGWKWLAFRKVRVK